jgi:hypothetical protein
MDGRRKVPGKTRKRDSAQVANPRARPALLIRQRPRLPKQSRQTLRREARGERMKEESPRASSAAFPALLDHQKFNRQS